jgi:hypothetical protein
MAFTFEKLEVYQKAVAFALSGLINGLERETGSGRRSSQGVLRKAFFARRTDWLTNAATRAAVDRLARAVRRTLAGHQVG